MMYSTQTLPERLKTLVAHSHTEALNSLDSFFSFALPWCKMATNHGTREFIWSVCALWEAPCLEFLHESALFISAWAVSILLLWASWFSSIITFAFWVRFVGAQCLFSNWSAKAISGSLETPTTPIHFEHHLEILQLASVWFGNKQTPLIQILNNFQN